MYKIGRVVIGENKTFVGGEEYLKQRGVEVVVFDDEKCKDLMKRFIEEKPDIWYVFHRRSCTTSKLTLGNLGMRILESSRRNRSPC